MKKNRLQLKVVNNTKSFFFLVCRFYEYMLVFLKRNYFNSFTKGLINKNIKFNFLKNWKKKINLKDYVNVHFLNLKNNIKDDIYGLDKIFFKNKKWKYKKRAIRSRSYLIRFIKKIIPKMCEFFKKTFSFKYGTKFLNYFWRWLKGMYRNSSKKMYSINNLLLYVYEIYWLLDYFNKLKFNLLQLIYNLKIKLNYNLFYFIFKRNKINNDFFKFFKNLFNVKRYFLFYVKQLLQHKNIIFYYFNNFRCKLNTFLTNKLQQNKNYFSYSFKFKNLSLLNNNKIHFNILNNFNIVHLFNNIIYKFFFYLNNCWINLYFNYSNTILYNNFKKKYINLLNFYTSYYEGRRRKVRKLNYVNYFRCNKYFLYFKHNNQNFLL